VFVEWLRTSRLRRGDAVLVLSVGGGDGSRDISKNLVHAVDHAKAVGAAVLGIVGRDGGHTARVADVCVIVPTVNPDAVTAHTEAFHAVICHLLVWHPRLRLHAAKWESASR
jgi:D-sedoheptulose 7-phosphate isomerase